MRIVVTAAIIEDRGRYFVTKRQKGVHLEGLWEFPGGTCEADESLEDCLRRELKEELGVDATIGEELFTVSHDYPDRSVELHFLSCALHHSPMPLLGQEMRWVARADLGSLTFLPADEQLIVFLQTATGPRQGEK
jgi:mutator protein MutT